MRTILLLTALLSCACPPKPATVASTGGQGSAAGSGATATPTRCEDLKTRVEALYRAEAQRKEPKRVEESVADNTAMVMSDCAKQPQVAMPCIANASTVAELEKQCLVPIDDEGTEGEK